MGDSFRTDIDQGWSQLGLKGKGLTHYFKEGKSLCGKVKLVEPPLIGFEYREYNSATDCYLCNTKRWALSETEAPIG